MDFSLNDDQTMLRDSIVQYLGKSYAFEKRMEVVDSSAGFSRDKWADFAELGWLSLPFEEQLDGFGGGPIEMMLLMQELGKGLVIEPYLATVVLGGGCLARGNNEKLRGSLIAKVMAGEIHLALAYAEAQSRFELAHVECRATEASDGLLLDGEKIVVMNGAAADYLVVSARTSGEQDDPNGITLFCIEAGRQGIERSSYKTVDGMEAAHIRFEGVRVDASDQISARDEGLAILENVIRDATLAVCSEALGIMEALTYKTIEYTKNRQQFGVPLSSFQALQHRMVEMFMELEQSRSLLLRAVIKCHEKAPDRAAAIAALKYYIGTAGRKLGEEAVQLHGGMGVTYEMDIAHYFKRLTVIDTLFGNSDYQMNRFVAAA
ncbi:MAG: pimeloyl-CoA dehydrogenase small subunit [Gammaproteobacteria bacterium]|nr:pimeloyl-CoA dehydrogenase small subunit [Gammaproteobacteria bacterium]